MVQRMPLEEVPRISVSEAKQMHDRNEAVLVDVRSKEAYDEAHVEGAIHMPAAEFPRRYSDLAHDKLIITY
ncbi:MAG: rhodanese-like domain-containing protein [Chloroflexi bacterium]|nr:rhodanese-like domain-containing protein [Chloroflexota bacterium]